MPKKLTTPDRVLLLLSLVAYLKKHGQTSVSALAAHFDVDEKLIRKLATFLGTAGIPGETLTYQHEDLFDIDWDALLYRDEVNLVHFVAVEETPRFSSAEIASLIAGVISLRSVLPTDMQQHIESVLSKLHEANATKPESISVSIEDEHEKDILRQIARAIQEARQVTFEYVDANGDFTHRTVDPFTLTQSSNGWYLEGYCHTREAERLFIVDRMRNLTLSHSSQTHDRKSNEHETPQDQEQDQHTSTLVKYRSEVAHLVADFLPVEMSTDPEGWVTATVELRHPGVAPRLIQRAPGDVVVLAPENARKAVFEWSQRALSHYVD